MNYDQIVKTLSYTEKESKIFLPNEIFTELKEAIPKNSPHLAFAYSYIYLVTWIYRYARHMTTEGFIDNGKLKQILRYSPINKELNYLIKKNGLLDQMGYTETVSDFPLEWKFNQYENLEFNTLNELISDEMEHNPLITKTEIKKALHIPPKYTVKYPVKAFFRTADSVEMDGTYYYFESTHCIPFEVFMYCMSKEEIGTTGFYLYSYIKRMNDMFNGWDIPVYKLAIETAIPTSTLERYLDSLRSYKMINVKHNQKYFSLSMRLEERKASTYITNEFHQFTNKPEAFTKLKVMTKEDIVQMQLTQNKHIWGRKVDFPLEELPF